MKVKHYRRVLISSGAVLLCMLPMLFCWVHAAEPAQTASIWARDNLLAWEAAPYDTAKRTPDERAQMLQRLGIKRYAYISSTNPWNDKDDVNLSQFDVDAEIEAMQRHGIEITAWYFWVNTDYPGEDANVRATLESFRRHRIQPQIWVAESVAWMPKTPQDWQPFLPKGVSMPASAEEYEALSEADRQVIEQAWAKVMERDFPKTPQEQRRRVQREAARIKAFVELAAPYDCRVNIYNHRGWFGMMDNQLAILQRLKELGVTTVGMVYNFAHSRDLRHDDSKDFPQIWDKIKSHVVAVNVVGLGGVQEVIYPSQGDHELAMMRTIQDSGWQGPVGILVLWKQADTEVVLRNALTGFDWLVAELNSPGSGGPRPLLPNP